MINNKYNISFKSYLVSTKILDEAKKFSKEQGQYRDFLAAKTTIEEYDYPLLFNISGKYCKKGDTCRIKIKWDDGKRVHNVHSNIIKNPAELALKCLKDLADKKSALFREIYTPARPDLVVKK